MFCLARWMGFAEFRRRFGGFACFGATEIVLMGGKMVSKSYIQL